jgi:putative serine protease PepD
MRSLKTSFLPALLGAAAGAVVAVLIASGSGGSKTVTTLVTSGQPASASVPSTLNVTHGMTINQIYRSASPGVVDITVTSQQSSNSNLFGGNSQQTEGEGAGVVYDKKGDIVTDEHVVANATSVVVHFNNGVTAPAKVLGTDPSTDVAVIHVNVPASNLHPIPFANSDTAQVGDPVVAIGSPFSLPETTTAGIVSAVGRSITAPNNFTISGAIQTDAAINPGNSGGPLLDGNGHVLGLNDQIQTNSGQSAGVGFATPANSDVQVANTIIAGRRVEHPYVGVCLNPLYGGDGAQVALSGGSSCATPIVAGSPAAKAGLQPGDVVTAINGSRIHSTNGFIATVGSYKPGQTVTMTVRRNGAQTKLHVTLGDRPATAPTG